MQRLDLQRDESVSGLIFYFTQNKIWELILFFLNSHKANSDFINPSDILPMSGAYHRPLWEEDTTKNLPYRK